MPGVKGRSGGQNRLSSEELALNGTLRNDRHGNMISDEPVDLTPPNWQDPDVIRDDVRRYLEETRTGRSQDHVYITQLVDQVLIYRAAKHAFAVMGVGGRIGNKLAVTVMSDAAKEIRILMAELRLSPATREKVMPTKTKDDDVLGGVQ